ncbi:MAG: aspartate aminotransferase family protein [Candidatus Methylomirabilales bacterium]
MNLKSREDLFSVGVYQKRDVAIVRGQAARVWDETGREYIDCVAGVGVANVGHCNPAVVKAIQDQATRLITCNELFYNDARTQCLERLNRITPEGIDRFFLCNSGTEAVEGAIKFARMATGRKRVVAAMRGFHGKTLGSLSATWDKKYRDPFAPLVPDFVHAAYNNVADFEKAIDDQTAAVILEPVQGEGGVRPASAEFFQAVRKACDDRGVLFIIDEIQTGFGRTGRMFACEHLGVLPDILTMAKGIAGGIPMGHRDRPARGRNRKALPHLHLRGDPWPALRPWQQLISWWIRICPSRPPRRASTSCSVCGQSPIPASARSAALA